MRKENNELVYETKGKVSTYQDGILHTMIIGKNNIKTDTVDVNQMFDEVDALIKSIGESDMELKLVVRKIDKGKVETTEEDTGDNEDEE